MLLAACDRRVVIDAVVHVGSELEEEVPGTDDLDAAPEPRDAEMSTGDGPGGDDASHHDDAAVGQATDAALDAAVADAGAGAVDGSLAKDARPEDARADTGPACDGTRVLSLCWYLGAVDTSCDQVCAGHAGNDPRAIALVGTAAQGGSLSNCAQVLLALGYTGAVISGIRDEYGIGCHLWDADGWWIETMPAFSTAAKTPYARIACACLR